MAKSQASLPRMFSALLKYWRGVRGMSQLDLALAAEVSSRHVSFLETGRAHPSRDMVLRLANTLEVPLRNQNEMLQAAGFEEIFSVPAPDRELPRPIAQALEFMLARQEPFPMVIMNRAFEVIRSNHAAQMLFKNFVADPEALVTPINAVQLLFDPRLVRPFVVDWTTCAHAVLSRLHRDALHDHCDGQLDELVQTLLAYPDVPAAWRQPDFSVPMEPVFAIRLQRGDLKLGFITTLTVFSAPQNVTLEELQIESYFPLDSDTETACRRLAEQSM